MFTQILFFYRDSVILSIAKNLAESLAKSQRGILHDVQDDRDLWVNCQFITNE